MQKYSDVVVSTNGNALAGALVTVKIAGTANNATLYSNNNGTGQANPVTTRADGSYEFYAQSGRYDLTYTKTGYAFTAANTSDVLLIDPSTTITPAALAVDANNYAPTDVSTGRPGLLAGIWRISASGAVSITGVTAGNPQQYLTVVNVGASTITLKHQSGSSAAANQIVVPGGADFILSQNDSATLVYDNTTTKWRVASTTVTLSSTNAGSSAYAVRGLSGTNNAGAPNTKFDMSADLVALRNPSSGAIAIQTNTGTKTNDTAVVGSAADGRDQAGAFGANSWIHLYFIWNGTTLSTLSSATAPPTGPTLPTGYTHWAYAGAVRYDAGSALKRQFMRGNRVYYEGLQNALSAGVATVETAVSLSSFIPPNAAEVYVHVFHTSTNVLANGTDYIARYRVTTGVDYFTDKVVGNGNQDVNAALVTFPNVSQQILYLTTTQAVANTVDLNVMGYSIPNGG